MVMDDKTWFVGAGGAPPFAVQEKREAMNDPDFELTAKVLVDQHYAAGPDALKAAVAEALREAATGGPKPVGGPRERLLEEVEQATKASVLGSE